MTGLLVYTAVVVPSTVVIPLAMGIYRYPRLHLPHKIIFYYLVFGGVMDVVAGYTSAHRINNLWLLHLYTAAETVILLSFYMTIIRDRGIRRVIPYLMVVFPLVCAANIAWWQSMKRFNTYTRPVEALLMMFAGLVYFLENSQMALDPKKGPRTSLTWINTGLLLYFSLSFFIFIFANYLHQKQLFNTFIQTLHATFVVIMYLLVAVGFYKCSR